MKEEESEGEIPPVPGVPSEDPDNNLEEESFELDVLDCEMGCNPDCANLNGVRPRGTA